MRLSWSQSRHYPDLWHDHTRSRTVRRRERNEHRWHVLDVDRSSGYYRLWHGWRVYVMTARRSCPQLMLIKVLVYRSSILYISLRVRKCIYA